MLRRLHGDGLADALSVPRSVMAVPLLALVVANRIMSQRNNRAPLRDATSSPLPHLTWSALHHCFQRHGISRLPDIEGDKPKRQRFKRYPIGIFHIDIAEVQTAEGKLHLFVGIDRTSMF